MGGKRRYDPEPLTPSEKAKDDDQVTSARAPLLLLSQGALDEGSFPLVERQFESAFLRARRDFLPGLLQNADHFRFVGFGGKFSKLKFKENQAKRIFEDTRLGIGRKIFLQVQVLDASD